MNAMYVAYSHISRSPHHVDGALAVTTAIMSNFQVPLFILTSAQEQEFSSFIKAASTTSEAFDIVAGHLLELRRARYPIAVFGTGNASKLVNTFLQLYFKAFGALPNPLDSTKLRDRARQLINVYDESIYQHRQQQYWSNRPGGSPFV